MAANFPKHVPHKLHLVTLIGSGIRRPWWEKQTLKTLRLTKLQKSVVLKNTPQNNELLRKVKTLVKVQPITFVENEPSVDNPAPLKKILSDLSKTPQKVGNIKLLTGPFLNQKGEFDIKKYDDYIAKFSDKGEVEDFEKIMSRNHIPGTETLNYDFSFEEEKKITDKGKRVELYFLKKIWPQYKRRLADRQKNLRKY